MEIEITGTEKKLFSSVDSEGLIGNEELAEVFLLSPLFKEGEGGNLFEIMA